MASEAAAAAVFRKSLRVACSFFIGLFQEKKSRTDPRRVFGSVRPQVLIISLWSCRSLFLRHKSCCHQCVQRGALGARVRDAQHGSSWLCRWRWLCRLGAGSGFSRRSPHLAKVVIRWLCLTPDAAGVGQDELTIVRALRACLIQYSQIANEDSFKLRAVGATAWFTAIVEDSLGIGQVRKRRPGDRVCQRQNGRVMVGPGHCG